MPLYAVILAGSATPAVVRHCAFKDVDAAIQHLGPFEPLELLFVSVPKNLTTLDEVYTFRRANGIFSELEIKYTVTHHEHMEEFKLVAVSFGVHEMLSLLNNAAHAGLLVAAKEDYRSRPKAQPHSG